MKIIESKETVYNVAESLAQVSAPMMQSGEIGSVNIVCRGEPTNVPEGTWVLYFISLLLLF